LIGIDRKIPLSSRAVLSATPRFVLASSAAFPQIASMSSRLAPALVVSALATSAYAGGFGIPEIGVRRTGMASIAIVDKLETKKNDHDSWEASGGVRVHDLVAAPKLDLMAGAQFDHSPAPPSTVTLDQPSFSHPGVHSGVRYTFGRFRLGASYIHYFYLIPTVDNSTTTPPSNFKGRGSNNIITLSIEARL
jgi:hypothetical protein